MNEIMHLDNHTIECYDTIMNDNIYYVYFYLRETASDVAAAGTPYYVGVGKGKRINRKGKKEVPMPSNKSLRVKVHENLHWRQALDYEVAYIKQYGRIDTGTGILRNKTDGGDGTHGRVMTTSERLYRSKIQKEVQNRPEVLAKRAASMAAVNATFETRAKRSESAKKLATLPGKQQAFSEASKERWQDPEYRRSLVEKHRAYWNNEDHRISKSKEQSVRWQDPEYARNVSNKIREACQKPEVREKRSKAHTGMKFWNDGVKCVRSKEQPTGFVPGRLVKPK